MLARRAGDPIVVAVDQQLRLTWRRSSHVGVDIAGGVKVQLFAAESSTRLAGCRIAAAKPYDRAQM